MLESPGGPPRQPIAPLDRSSSLPSYEALLSLPPLPETPRQPTSSPSKTLASKREGVLTGSLSRTPRSGSHPTLQASSSDPNLLRTSATQANHLPSSSSSSELHPSCTSDLPRRPKEDVSPDDGVPVGILPERALSPQPSDLSPTKSLPRSKGMQAFASPETYPTLSTIQSSYDITRRASPTKGLDIIHSSEKPRTLLASHGRPVNPMDRPFASPTQPRNAQQATPVDVLDACRSPVETPDILACHGKSRHLLSTDIESSTKRSRPVLETKGHLPPVLVHSSDHRQGSSPQPPDQSSFNMHLNPDASLIGDCSFLQSTKEDDSLDFGIEALRPSVRSKLGPSAEGDGQQSYRSITPTTKTTGTGEVSNIPTGIEHKTSQAVRQAFDMRRLAESSRLPSSPAKSAHLLASTHAISREEAPWTVQDSISDIPARARDSRRSPDRYSSTHPSPLPLRSSTDRKMPDYGVPLTKRSPSRSPSKHETLTRSKRTFPASSSGNSLASVGEEPGRHFDPDLSMLLPPSPKKLEHLLGNEELLSGEVFVDEGPSVYATLPRNILPSKRSPNKVAVSAKDMTQTSRPMKDVDIGDITMDVQELMARMRKPKRASGTEESFADLLHGDGMPDGLDMSILADETFLPAELRPRHHLPSSRDRLRVSSPLKTHTARRRSNSVSDLAPTGQGLIPSSRQASPIKTAGSVRPSGISPVRQPSLAPAVPRTRPGLAPCTTGTKRISLSAGALPIANSASHRFIALPSAPTSRARTTSISSGLAEEAMSDLPSRRPSVAFTRQSIAPRVARPSLSVGASTITTARPRVEALAKTMRPPQPSIAPTRTTEFRMSPTLKSSLTAITRTTTSFLARPTQTSLGSAIARPAQLPRPGTGSTARSAPLAYTAATTTVTKPSRSFGADAASSTNRMSRPTAAVPIPRSSKLSAGPDSSPSKRADLPSKSRSMSTPAVIVGRPLPSHAARPPLPSLTTRQLLTHVRSTRPTEPVKRSLPLTSASLTSRSTVLPTTTLTTSSTGTVGGISSALQKPRSGSGLPQASSVGSRLPPPAAPSASALVQRTMAGTATGSRSSKVSYGVGGLADIRARMGALGAQRGLQREK